MGRESLTSARDLCGTPECPCGDPTLCGTVEPSAISARPACEDECMVVLRDELAKSCAKLGIPVPDVGITHVAPLIPPLYVDLRMTCPHGVTWHMQPTSEQIAKWVEEGVA